MEVLSDVPVFLASGCQPPNVGTIQGSCDGLTIGPPRSKGRPDIAGFGGPHFRRNLCSQGPAPERCPSES
jgi:hypothetical protein